jgi:hypothetical protein
MMGKEEASTAANASTGNLVSSTSEEYQEEASTTNDTSSNLVSSNNDISTGIVLQDTMNKTASSTNYCSTKEKHDREQASTAANASIGSLTSRTFEERHQ